MKTVFVTVTQGYLARTLFTTGLIAALLKNTQVRVVAFVPQETYDFMVREHVHERLVFEGLTDVSYSRVRKAFVFFSRFILINATSINLAYYGSGKARRFGYIYALCFPFLFLLNCIPHIRSGIQWLNRIFFPDTVFDSFFETYKPDVVLVSNILAKVDVAFLKAARRFRVRSIAMTKGWDNLDKYYLQVKADTLIVQVPAMVRYAKRYQGYAEKDIIVSGFPAFDFYRTGPTTSRDVICAHMGLDPQRKILFFGSEGVWSSHDDRIVEKLILWIHENAFETPCSLIIRPHFGEIPNHRFMRFKNIPHVYVFDTMRTVEGFSDLWYSDISEMEYFVSVMYALDVMISVRSTLSLDAIACDKPVINLTRGAYIEKSGRDATENLYKHIFYKDLLALSGITLAGTDDEIRQSIDTYLRNPNHAAHERAATRALYCVTLTGESAVERIASFVFSQLS